MERSYDIDKSAHMAMEFLHLAGGRLDVLSLIKFMYLADRASLATYGYPISYDQYYSLPYGPVLSQVYENTKGNTRAEDHVWSTLIEKKEGSDTLVLMRYEEPLSLSTAELEVIHGIHEEHKSFIGPKFIDHIHQICPEWEDPQGSSRVIPLDRILHKIGFDEEVINRIQSNLNERAKLEAL